MHEVKDVLGSSKNTTRKMTKSTNQAFFCSLSAVISLAQRCNAGLFSCHNGMCVPQRYVCDHDDDCGDRSDELNCSMWLPSLSLSPSLITVILVQINKCLIPPLALQHILHVEATTSPVPVAAASIKSGFVMERMTVKIMQMKKAVVCIQ